MSDDSRMATNKDVVADDSAPGMWPGANSTHMVDGTISANSRIAVNSNWTTVAYHQARTDFSIRVDVYERY
jgi:hypothetical protein